MMDSNFASDDDTNSPARRLYPYRPDELMVEQMIREYRDRTAWDDMTEYHDGDVGDDNDPGNLSMEEVTEESDSEHWDRDVGTLNSTVDTNDQGDARGAYDSNLAALAQFARQPGTLGASGASQVFDREASTSSIRTSGDTMGTPNVLKGKCVMSPVAQEQLLLGMPPNEPGASNTTHDMPSRRLGPNHVYAVEPGHAQPRNDASLGPHLGDNIPPRALDDVLFPGNEAAAELRMALLLANLERGTFHLCDTHPEMAPATSHSTPGDALPRTRTKYSEMQLRILHRVLISNPYPSAAYVSGLVQILGLTVKNIRTWLANHRLRPTLVSASSQRSSSATNMVSLTAKSGATSEASHAAQTNAGQSILRVPSHRGARKGRKLSFMSQEHVMAPGSFSSIPDDVSSLIEGSQDTSSEYKEQTSHVASCTWPGCDKTFTGFTPWCRHEALHYQPVHYVCCLESTDDTPLYQCCVCFQQHVTIGHVIMEHLAECMGGDRNARTFYRRDHLVQHIKQVHRILSISSKNNTAGKHLLDHWTVDHFHASPYASVCIFCGHRFPSWTDRAKHVYKHVEARICRFAWWPERLPLPREAPVTAVDGVVTCANCQKQCGSISATLQHHAECTAWSCSFLHDFHGFFDTLAREENTGNTWISTCKLCNFTAQDDILSTPRHQDSLHNHAQQAHEYRSCNQDRFDDAGMFVAHLRVGHHATRHPESRDDLLPWSSYQWLKQDEAALLAGHPHVLTARAFQTRPENHLCSSDVCSINFGV